MNVDASRTTKLATVAPDVTALRLLARQRDRDLAFACGFLPVEQRGHVLQVLAVFDQLSQVLGLQPMDGQPEQSTDSCGEACATPGSPGAPGNVGGCSSAAADAGGACASDPSQSCASADPNNTAEGCTTCGGGSLEQRREVCSSVLAYLFEGNATGKPTLDGFHQVARACGLQRDLFEQWCDGWVTLLSTPRIATWSRLRSYLDATTGRTMVAVAQAIHRGELDAKMVSGAQAWGAGWGLMAILSGGFNRAQAEANWLPLDDLVACRITERELAAWRAEPVEADADRWASLVRRLTERAATLQDEGAAWLVGLPTTLSRGPAVWGQMQQLRWQRWSREPGRLLAGDHATQPTGMWDRVRATRGAMRVLSRS